MPCAKTLPASPGGHGVDFVIGAPVLTSMVETRPTKARQIGQLPNPWLGKACLMHSTQNRCEQGSRHGWVIGLCDSSAQSHQTKRTDLLFSVHMHDVRKANGALLELRGSNCVFELLAQQSELSSPPS